MTKSLMENVDDLFQLLVEEGDVIIHHKGSYSEEFLESILNEIEQVQWESKKNRRKIFYISVELLQNVFHHAMRKINGIEENYFHFIISKIDLENYKISAGNFVNKNKYDTLVSRIEQLNLLEKIEVKQLYKTILNNNQFSQKGGGGLGMIDIKRKSDQKFEYNRVNYNKNLYFFNFSVFLKNKF